MEKYYTTQEVAEILGVQPRTVREWIHLPEDPLPAIALGNSYRIPEVALSKWLQRRTISSNRRNEPTG